MSKNFPFYEQIDSMDCGAACLRMIAKYHGQSYPLSYLKEITYLDREGVSLLGISDAAEKIGLKTLAAPIPFQRLAEDIPLPAIGHWENNHFVVVYKATKKHVWIGDPATELKKISKEEFLAGWARDYFPGQDAGILLLLEPTPDFDAHQGEPLKRHGFYYFLAHLKKYKGLVFQLILGVFLVSIFQVILPFLMQALIDVGVNIKDIGFIYLVLLAQLILVISQTVVETLRNYIVLHIGIRVNIDLMSEFLRKLMQLPIKFFDTHIVGDLLQRIYDNQRIEQFLTSSTLLAFFSIVNFVIFGFVLFVYNLKIFLLFLFGTALYVAWVTFCLMNRKTLDYRRFEYATENQNALVQLIAGMQEIKLHNAEMQKRWIWESIQAKIYRISKEFLAINQRQRIGTTLINDAKNIIITVVAAQAVIKGEMTLGMLVAIQYIIGQLNGPVEQLIGFFRMAQDARISIERMNEIHQREEIEDLKNKLNILPEDGSLELDHVSFRYNGPSSPMVLKNISFRIPEGQTTAIVGTSGSGKTTLLKLLLGFYAPMEGMVKLGNVNLSNIHGQLWRDQCSAVLQDGYIFSDTIANNIAFGQRALNKKRLLQAAKIANIQSFVDKLPLGYNTKIGQDGSGISEGQKQRILIARAVYKNPQYLFLDEATNPLDTYNEMLIMENLEDFLKGKTVIIVAQRLSTIINADNIVVLEQGEIVEQGTHGQLVNLRGAYYQLFKNQMELSF